MDRVLVLGPACRTPAAAMDSKEERLGAGPGGAVSPVARRRDPDTMGSGSWALQWWGSRHPTLPSQPGDTGTGQCIHFGAPSGSRSPLSPPRPVILPQCS